jgi:hypothetical protein
MLDRSPLRTLGIPIRILGLLIAAVWPMYASATSDMAVKVEPKASPSPQGTQLSSGEVLRAPLRKRANFLGEAPSAGARQVADWAASSGDNGGLPFVVIDKIRARLFVFDAAGLLRGASMALLGFAHGDDAIPGVGARKLAAIRPEERITPAGRFVAALGRDLQQDILWVDYDNSISLHRVVTGNPGDHRRQRLLGLSPLNKRISYGCINVPARFYDEVVRTVFAGTSGIVYILPEQHKLRDVFPLSEPAPRG